VTRVSSFLRAVVLCLFAGGACAAWPQNVVDSRIASLKQRYPTGTLYLGPPALNDIRSILREPLRRRKIDRESEPIPLAAKTLHTYTDSIFRSTLDSTQGVVLLIIDFDNARAFEKRASDTSGGVATLPWLPQEVRAAAILSDDLIRANATSSALVDLLRDGAANPLVSWRDFQEADADLVTDDSLSTYVQLLVSKVKMDPKELEEARLVDPIAYRQVSALLINQRSVENATVNFAATPNLRACKYSYPVATYGATSVPCIALHKASQSMLKESFDASKQFVVVSDDDAMKAIRAKFLTEVEALTTPNK
jgi:hypothetical protein